MPLAQWQKVLDTNLTGALLFAEAAGARIPQARSGKIMYIASVVGHLARRCTARTSPATPPARPDSWG